MIGMRLRLPIAVAAVLALAGCAGSSTGGDRGTPPAATTTAAANPLVCPGDGRRVYASLPARRIAKSENAWPSGDGALSAIKGRKRLVIGVSGDAVRWGFSDPTHAGKLSGYDVELATHVAEHLGFTDKQIEFRAVPLSGRIAALTGHQVDLVAERFSMTCARWSGTPGKANTSIDFSDPYYVAYQKLLVRKNLADSGVESLADLAKQDGPDRSICAVTGSTSLQYLQAQKVASIVTAADSGQCLVKFQEGEAAAISADETTLAGFAAQDKYARVVGNGFGPKQFYGLGTPSDSPVFTGYVNTALKSMRDDGTLTRLYDRWMRQYVQRGSHATGLPAVDGSRNPNKLGRS